MLDTYLYPLRYDYLYNTFECMTIIL
jgi:hypothetical protein